MIKKIYFQVWYMIGISLLTVGCIMCLGVKGARNFLEDMSLRLQVEKSIERMNNKNKKGGWFK